MSLSVCILASGSSGNCTYISSESTAILIDAGISGLAVARRLEEIGVALASIQAVCISHEHDDHVRGVSALHKRHPVTMYANAGTLDALHRNPRMRTPDWQVFTTGMSFAIGDLQIESFQVPHDAYEPVGFVVSSGSARVGIATDLGTPTALIRERLRRCRMVIVEANHDEALLQEAERPWNLKQRIRGRQGHLSNTHAASMLAEIATPDLNQVFLAHLSEDCNRRELALEAAQTSLNASGNPHVKVSVAFPDRVSEVWTG